MLENIHKAVSNNSRQIYICFIYVYMFIPEIKITEISDQYIRVTILKILILKVFNLGFLKSVGSTDTDSLYFRICL